MADSLDQSAPPDGSLFVIREGTVLLAYNFYGVYHDTASWVLRMSRSTDSGASFTTSSLARGYYVDPSVYGNGRDTCYYLSMFNTINGNHLYLRRSTDAGVTWGPSVVVDSAPGYHTVDKPMFKARGSFILVTFTDVLGNNRYVRVNHSTNAGQTWNLGLQGIDSAVGQGSCPAIAPNYHAFAAWSSPYGTLGNNIYFSRSTDFGVTWSTPYSILSLNWSTHLNSTRALNTFPSLTVDGNGKLYLAVADRLQGAGWDVAVISSTNEGTTWTTPVHPNDETNLDSDQIRSWITIDHRNRPHVFWYDDRNYYPTYSGDVYYSYSTDGGLTWQANERVNDATPCWTSGSFSYMGDYQQIGCDSSNVYCEWSDHRYGQNSFSYIATTRRSLPALGVEQNLAGNPWSRFSLAQNAPNPVLEGTGLAFQLEKPSRASLKVYDLTGKLVRTVVEASLPAGRHHVKWDGRDESGKAVPSGVYFYRLESGDLTATRKLVVAR